MTSKEAKKEQVSHKTSNVNFRKSLTWDPEDQSGSLNRAQNFITKPLNSKSTKKKKRIKAMCHGINRSKSSRTAARSRNMSDAEFSHLSFATDVPERIIRQGLVVFDKFDDNADGMITKEQLGRSLNDMGIQTTKEQLNEVMDMFDTNHDNQISVEEFVQMVRKIGLFKGRDDLMENDAERENIKCAFIALGGAADYSGTVSYEKLKTMVQVFDLDLDVDSLADRTGMVNFKEFGELFDTTRVQKRSLIQEIIDEENEQKTESAEKNTQ